MSRPVTSSTAAMCWRRSTRHSRRPIWTSCKRALRRFDAAINRLRAELGGYDLCRGRYRQIPTKSCKASCFCSAKRSMTPSYAISTRRSPALSANLKTGQDEEAVLVQRLETMKSIETMRRTLMDKEVGSRLNLSAVARCAPRGRKQSVARPWKPGGLRASGREGPGGSAGVHRGVSPNRLSGSGRDTGQAQQRCGRTQES